ncbi:LysM peptidoglycan-binding domain-containing protein [bacterium]|nr:LysM peptidoglycan-binding domain-containing protein [bacterium]MBT3853578.1 LysM peptidoglycan-binding domain-containing protein [bacterium]MBT4633590.1 LysM peptidoglycan-binding domain-containing protein [bacterium]MBT6779143.1 LysM peptidoglycan-binding domain-containing protein [bacterium]
MHIVKKNESISDIAKLYNISDDEVLKYNSFLKK